MGNLIGRKEALFELDRLCETPRSEFAIVSGRRRVGKTYLVREYFGYEFAFYTTGIAGGNARAQMTSFNKSLRKYGSEEPPARDWFEAFGQLEQLLAGPDIHREETGGKRVVFIDEMPWLDAPRTDFLMALELFWNSWGSAQKDLLLIACGSATSWIIKNIFKNRGGLHNRVTARIALEPFTLKECEEYYRANGFVLSREQMIESYMVFGGVPYYLDMFHRRLGLVQNIDRLCFARQGALRAEFDELYHSLFKNAERHVSIVRTLARRRGGLTRAEISAKSRVANGGTLTKTLEELEACGFIRKYREYSKRKNEATYQLIDPFTLFYLHFMEDQTNEHFWSENYQGTMVRAWEGYAFELVCLLHVDQIRASLGVQGVAFDVSSWRSAHTEPGAQIDLVIDRRDGVINLCEMKFWRESYEISRKYDEELRHKREAFLAETGTHKSLHLTMVSPYGVKHNAYWQTIQGEITAEDLFR